jgi:hypothetical protein
MNASCCSCAAPGAALLILIGICSPVAPPTKSAASEYICTGALAGDKLSWSSGAEAASRLRLMRGAAKAGDALPAAMHALTDFLNTWR